MAWSFSPEGVLFWWAVGAIAWVIVVAAAWFGSRRR